MAEGSGYSLADIAAIGSGRDGFFGGSGGMGWIAILFLFVLFAGNGMWGGNGSVATQDMVQGSFNYSNLLDQNRDILNSISAGAAQAVAATNQAKYDNINVAKDIQMALSSQIAQVANMETSIGDKVQTCCCETQRSIDNVNYNNALNTASINATTTAQTQKILDALAQNKIDALQGQINSLQLQNAVAGVVRYPSSTTFSAGVPPIWGGPAFGPAGF